MNPSCNAAASCPKSQFETNDNIADNVKLAAASTAADNIPMCDIMIGSIKIPEYYKGCMPAEVKVIYRVLGVKFVHLRHASIDYFILDSAISAVVERLKLYV